MAVTPASSDESAPFPSPHPGAVWLELRSEAVRLYLYDEGHREALEASPMSADGPEMSDHPEFAAAADRGLIQVFDYAVVEREDPFGGFLYVGPPPDPARVKRASLRSPQRGRLDLPTGRLRVETYSGLTIGRGRHWARVWPGAGIEVRIPRGRYDVAVYESREEYMFIVLTQMADEERAPEPESGSRRRTRPSR
jgi:hypothetical protein